MPLNSFSELSQSEFVRNGKISDYDTSDQNKYIFEYVIRHLLLHNNPYDKQYICESNLISPFNSDILSKYIPKCIYD